jgi:proteasome assembly chaperone (PAC2) family protein
MRNEALGGWEVTTHKELKIKTPILIEGMPGIGNVGKIAMDIIIEETKATLWKSFFSNDMPNSVFVNEDNLIDLPRIGLYHKRIKNQDYLFLTGDIQPTSESSSYEFCSIITKIFAELKGRHVITLGGIGLAEIPENPKVYITGNNKQFLEQTITQLNRKKLAIETKIYGVVGPILGVSGLLLGVTKKNGINAYSLLSETFGHPIYIGLKGAKSILAVLDKNYSLGISFKKLDKEIMHIDAQSKGLSDDLSGVSEDVKDKVLKYRKYSDVNYIG